MARIHTHFRRIGARVEILPPPRSGRVTVDIAEDVFQVAKERRVLARVLHAAPATRHLLLLTDDGDRKDRFVCGHDERHWFVAAVPGTPITVAEALEQLKPRFVRELEAQTKLRKRHRQRRRNAVFVRQGEWFFIPEPDVAPAEWLILRNEPLTRGAGSKPHVCDEMVRTGGEIVWVHPVYAPRGTTPERYAKLAGHKRAQTSWQQMRRNPAVYVRGRVRHADHKTIRLPGWHRVLMNTESEAPAAHRVVFLD